MQEKLKGYLIVAVVSGLVVFFVASKESGLIWQGFYYKDGEYTTSSIDQITRLDSSPRFSTLQDCMKWGKDMITSNPNDGFECSYGCRYDKEWSSLICKDTTKMITTIKNEGTYSE